MTISFSPQQGGPKYAPHRDLAYITPTLLRAAVMSLDPVNLSDADRSYMARNSVSEGELGECVERLVDAQSQFVSSFDARHVDDVLRHAGFDNCSHAVRTLMFAAFGRALIGAWFQAVRDVTYIGQVPAEQDNMSRFYAVALRIAGNLQDRELTDAEQLIATANRLTSERIHLQMQLSSQAGALTTSKTRAAMLDSALRSTADENARLRVRIQELEVPWYRKLVSYVFSMIPKR